MKTVFDIGFDEAATDNQVLLLEVGEEFCSYAFFQKGKSAITKLKFLACSRQQLEATVTQVLADLKEFNFSKIFVSSAFPQALLIPNKFASGKKDLLDLVYDEPSQAYFFDAITEWQIVNAYALPSAICHLIDEAFQQVQYYHAYTPAIKTYNGYSNENQVSIHFMPQQFRVLLKKENQIQLAQTYEYTTPLDVVYYLLKICTEFSLSQQETHWVLSGLIEKDSNLYAELKQYFLNLHFSHQPEIGLPESNLPQHYFNAVFNLAACAS